MKTHLEKSIFSIVFNLFIIGCGLYCVAGIIRDGGFAPDYLGAKVLVFYTVLSNLFLLISCLIYTPLLIASVADNKNHLPKWVSLMKYNATITTTITFLVVMVFLGPTQGYGLMLSSYNLYMHLICPVAGIVTLIAFDQLDEIDFYHTIYAIIPTETYSMIYLVFVFGCPTFIGDFYHFFAFGNGVAIAIFFGMYALVFGLANLFRYCINKNYRAIN